MPQHVLHLSLPVRDLAEARRFYEDVMGCRVGRTRADWVDVWFFGLQLTLQERPGEVVPLEEQGVRHFGVALDREAFERCLGALRGRPVQWLGEVSTDRTGLLSGKTSVKLADPSGNVIEVKCYDDVDDALG